MFKLRVIAIPPIGKYTTPLRNTLKGLGFNLQEQMTLTRDMIDKGCKHSSEMMCFPFKATLGYFMEALDKGANTLLMFDSNGQCRFRHYYIIQEHTLQNLGYKDFEMIPIRANHMIKSFKRIDKNLTTFKILKAFKRTWKELKEIEKQTIKPKFNIGIIGEIYTVMEDSLNFNIEQKIKRAGMNPYNCVTMTHFLRHYLIKDKYFKQGLKYFNGPLGGHGIQNVGYTLMLIEKKFDGIIWFRPLSCMPEQTVDPIIKSLCDKANIPLLVIDIDETSAEANVATRIETFFELVQYK